MEKSRDNSLIFLILIAIIMVLLNFGDFVNEKQIENERLDNINAEVTQKARSL